MPRWLDAREARAWEGLQFMHLHLDAELARQLAMESSLSFQDYVVLVALTAAPDDRLRAFELAEAIGWDKTRLSHHLKRMTERGLIERRPCPTDRRGQFVVVTSAGRDAIESAAPGHVASVRRLFLDHVTDAELDVIADVAERVSRHLDRPPTEDPP